MYLFSYSFWELCITKKINKKMNSEGNCSFSHSPTTPSQRHLTLSLSLHILLVMLMISPRCILMQGLSTLFPFIHIQMCSYCLFALGPFKMPFWNMPFDKHIIGQVPAVIRALFNVSKLESEWGTPEPAAIHSPPSSSLDVPRAAGEGPGVG